MNNKQLLQLAKNNLQNSYSPYSNFPVSAVVELNSGELFYGVNVENASFGATNCAERSALYSLYSQGHKKEDIKKMVIISNLDYPISPCGICRQVISELVPIDTPIILGTNTLEYIETTISELLPMMFTEDDLKK